ncbi:MAG: hypothetical protein KC996_08695 [Phycisphaerales bacterium]|nr:hypothetical protein [Phycisphaerales bacterium]
MEIKLRERCDGGLAIFFITSAIDLLIQMNFEKIVHLMRRQELTDRIGRAVSVSRAEHKR